MILVPSNESKETLKQYEELWNKIKDLIRSITSNSDDYHEKYMKIKFDLDENVPLKKTVKLHSMTIIIRSVFQEGNKYYPQCFLNEWLYKL